MHEWLNSLAASGDGECAAGSGTTEGISFNMLISQMLRKS